MAEPEEYSDKKPGSSAKWRGMLRDAEKAETNYHHQADGVDDQYAKLERLASGTSDRELQIFWANLEVMKPSVYTRPPTPVVAPRFKDRKPLPRSAGDVLERALIADIEADGLHDTLLQVRDDLVTNARGVAWLRLGERDGVPVAIAEHVDRKDFRHEPARKWQEVGWVARRSFLSKREVKQRFGEVPATMKFEKHKIGDFEGERKAEVWELWHREESTVVWVCEDCEYLLDQQEPFLDLTGFFPCPRPAYGTLQRGTLVPIPDWFYYRDQIEEINELTAKIGALNDAIKVRGFYSAGNSDLSEAIEKAFRKTDPNAILEPVHSLASMGVQALKDAIVWFPIEVVAGALQVCTEQRRLLIDDVYQITGLSDIMRGSTDPNETLGAQQLKSQYGSIRVREKQGEMQRIARDIIRLKAEIMCEEVPIAALLEMSQVDDIPSEADLAQQAQQIQAQAQQAIMGLVQQAMMAMQQPQVLPQGAQMGPM